MSRALAWLLGCTLLMANLPAGAIIVQDLYSAEVPVADQSGAALDSGASAALTQVLVKVSGSAELLRSPAIRGALGKARSHVQQYSYKRADSPEGGLMARFEFDGNYVTSLVKEAGAPLWTANRPEVLVWLVADDGAGPYFVNPDSAPELAKELLAAFARRGVPARLPLYDLADSAAIGPDQAWRLAAPTLETASLRYGVKDILAGRLAASSASNWVGEWTYLAGEEQINRPLNTPTQEAFLQRGAALVAEEMAARYAVATGMGDGSGVALSVVGVNAYADYAAIVAWLEGLELVEQANLERIEGDSMYLHLQTGADAAGLATVIELNPRLQPLPPVAGEEGGLAYQWTN